jgi:hypothetical protein
MPVAQAGMRMPTAPWVGENILDITGLNCYYHLHYDRRDH